MEMIIRSPLPGEQHAMEALTRRAFYNKFGPGCNEHLLVRKLLRHEDYLPELSRVAEAEGQLAGLILYFKAHIVSGERVTEVASFGPLCVDHRYKNMGIGSALLQQTLPLVRKCGFPGAVIFGEPEYYPRHGFVPAGSLGLSTMEGETFDAFLAWESTPGALRIPGGRFAESSVAEGLSPEELAAMEAEFEPLPRAYRPCQWSYDNATDEEDGYHLVYGVQRPGALEGLFDRYMDELEKQDETLKNHSRPALLRYWRDRVQYATYVICHGQEAIGLFVCSACDEHAPFGAVLDEIYLVPAWRKKGIGGDVFLRFLRQQPRDVAFYTIAGYDLAENCWEGLLKRAGYAFDKRPGAVKRRWEYIVHIKKD